MVDLPEAERPVNQTVAPFCLRRSVRSVRVKPECHVMLLSPLLGFVNVIVLGALSLSLAAEADRGVVEGQARREDFVQQLGRTHVAIAADCEDLLELVDCKYVVRTRV